MGNTVPTASIPQSTQDPKTFLQTEPELSKFIIVDQLGSSKFMKTYRCKISGMPVVVKVYVKRDPEEDLRVYEEKMAVIRRRLSPHTKYPNVLPYQRWLLSQRPFVRGSGVPSFLIRQHFLSNLYDRISTRPFLSPVEKKWMTYQLLRALEQLQSAGVCHGDIKTENVMVTSWNWVVLTDLAACFKPHVLPDDDPADFHYFFDSSGRRRCYLAPERLGGVNMATGSDLLDGLDGGEDNKGPSEEAMDLFSMGCVIAELYMDGEGPFDLPALLAYRACPSDSAADAFLTQRISKIADPVVHELCRILMARDPRRRKTARKNRELLESSPSPTPWFPSSFSSFLYDLMASLQPQHVTPDDRILAICEAWGELLWSIAGIRDPEGEEIFTHYARTVRQQTRHGRMLPAEQPAEAGAIQSSDSPAADSRDGGGAADPASSSLASLVEQTRRFLQSLEGGGEAVSLTEEALPPPPDLPPTRPPRPPTAGQGGRPHRSDVGAAAMSSPPPADANPDALIIVAHLICSNIRHLRFPQGKAVSLRLLQRLGMFVDDEARLQRLTPYVMAMLDDDNVYVKVMALRTLTCLLRSVRTFPVVSDAFIFANYIHPELAKIANDQQELVRIAFAECVASLAETAKRFLDVAYASKQQQQQQQQAKGGGPPASGGGGPEESGAGVKKRAGGRGLGESLKTYDEELRELHRTVQTWVQVIAQDAGSQSSAASSAASPMAQPSGGQYAHVLLVPRGHSLARRALLRDIMRLCIFFGQETTLELLIPILNTFFNDKVDWELRCALCDHIPSVCAFVGRLATEQYILPCIDTVLVDIEERVIAKVLSCLATLVQLGLLSRHAMLDKTKAACPLLLHPSAAIRSEATRLVAAVAKALGFPDADVFLVPLLRPFLRYDLLGAETVTDTTVSEALQAPISRAAFGAALVKMGDKRKRKQAQQRAGMDMSTVSGSSMVILPDLQLMGNSTLPSESVVMVGGEADRDLEGILNAVGIDFPIAVPVSSTHRSASSSSLQSTPPPSSTPSGRSSPFPPPPLPQDSLSPPLLPFGAEAEEEAHKLKLMEPYLDACMAHTSGLTKPFYQQHQGGGSSGRPGTGGGGASVRRQDAGRGGGSSDPSVPPLHQRSLTLSTSCANTIAVPHQWSLPSDLPPPDYNKYRADPYQLPDLKATYRLYGRSLGVAMTRGKQQPTPLLDFDDGASSGSISEGSTPTHGSLGGMRGGMRRPMSSGALVEAASTAMGAEGEMLLDKVEGGGADPTKLIHKVKALKVPPLPPDLGSLCQPTGQPFSYYVQPLSSVLEGSGEGSGTAAQRAAQGGWRPKEGVLVGTLTEHTRAVNRLAVSQDFHFFASASDDGTVKIWELRGTDAGLLQRSSLTYARQGGRILDLTMCDNSHSFASASSEGSVHVVRVDVAVRAGDGSRPQRSGSDGMLNMAGAGTRKTGVRVSGSSVVRTLEEDEGPVLTISHLNTATASLLVYGTQKGRIHCWDLRTDTEAWVLEVPVELGFLTSMAVGTERQSWLCAGTDRGYILLWDLRFQLLVKVWRHSSHGPIHRLAVATRLPQDSGSSGDDSYARPLLYVAAGGNEVAVWDLSQGGACKQCFRSVLKGGQGRGGLSREALRLPELDDVPVPAAQRGAGREPFFFTGAEAHTLALQELQLGGGRDSSSSPSVRAIMGRIAYNNPQSSYLITGSSDRHIRFWDLYTPAKCFTVSGLEPGQPHAQYFCPPGLEGGGPGSKLFLCRDSPLPSAETTLPSRLPLREQRGPVPPNPGHRDAILDLKALELQPSQGGRVMLSCSRDNTIKLWK